MPLLGPTVGDRVRLAERDLLIEVTEDRAMGPAGSGDEVIFGGRWTASPATSCCSARGTPSPPKGPRQQVAAAAGGFELHEDRGTTPVRTLTVTPEVLLGKRVLATELSTVEEGEAVSGEWWSRTRLAAGGTLTTALADDAVTAARLLTARPPHEGAGDGR